jgi:Bacteriophage head to tail connecting protein
MPRGTPNPHQPATTPVPPRSWKPKKTREYPQFQEVDWPTRSQYLKRLTALRTERSSWIDHWRQLSLHVLPRRSRFVSSDKDRGFRKDKFIINSTATKDLRTLAAGMMSGCSSPARPWFKLTTVDEDLAQHGPVKDWLEREEDGIRRTFEQSNFYVALQTQYENLALFGTDATVMEEDPEDVVRCYVQPIGAYMLAQGGRCQVDTIYREISLTVGQIVKRFGLENVSNFVYWNYQKGNYDFWVYCIQVIEPNARIDNVRFESKYKKFRTAWFELGAFSGSTGYDSSDSGYSGEPLNFLMEGGYDEFPALCPRWQVTGMEDIYGESPMMDCLGDVKSLQTYERQKARLIAKIVDPPMKGPSSLKAGRANTLPGDITYVDSGANGQTFEPSQTFHPGALEAVNDAIEKHVQRIHASTYSDVWLMIQEIDAGKMTATEVAERKEEKMLQLGPIVERMNGELLAPAVERVFQVRMKRGLVSPPPPELRGEPLQVKFVSIMAQAQRAIGVQSLQSTVSFTQSIAQMRPDVTDNLDVDSMVEEYGDLVGLKPSLLVPQDQVAQLRQQRAQQQQQQQQLAMAEQGSKAAKNLAGADTTGDNGLTRLLQGLGPAVAPTGAGGTP